MEIDDVREILPLFLNHSHAAVAIKDLSGRYLFANKEFLRYAAVPDTVAGLRDEQFLSPDRLAKAQVQERRALETGHGNSSDESFIRSGGATSYLTARFPIFDERHRAVALGMIAMEITADQRSVAEAERALKEAQHVNQQLRGAIFALEELASTDRLTNAWNRRRFEETIEGETHRSARYGHPLSMLMIDVDNFKQVNDAFGHREGDRVLVEISTRVRELMRKADSLTRWGGEEFIVLMPNTALGRAHATATRICDAIAASELETVGRITVSIGVAEYLATESPEEWLERADRAMYRAKESGRNQVVSDPARGTAQSQGEHLEGNYVQLVWKDAFRCGNSMIDRQHTMLFSQANDLLEAVLSGRPQDELVMLVDRLIQGVEEHFRDEEWILGTIAFANLEQHRREHAGLLGRCKQLVGEFEAGTVRIGELFQFLAHELVTRHILGADREYFPLVAQFDGETDVRG